MYRLRKCDSPSDATHIHAMVTELAEFEKGLDSLETTVDDYMCDGFKRDPPLFHAVFAEYCEKPEKQDGSETWTPVGYALWFFSFSSWKGRCFYLEDLYVKPAHRRNDLGTKLYSFCVNEAFESKCRAFDYVVLKWNEPALRLYKSFGVSPRDNGTWHLMRMDEEQIAKFVNTKQCE